MEAQLAAAPDARLYVAHGQSRSDLILRPSAGVLEAVCAFAGEIRTPTRATAGAARRPAV
jgi:hypothetical protein